MVMTQHTARPRAVAQRTPPEPHLGPLLFAPIDRATHLAFLRATPTAGFLQFPSWGDVKPGWQTESGGWFDGEGRLVGAALILYRKIPRLPWWFAYLPEGPLIDWSDPSLERWTAPLLDHLRTQGVFTVRIGPPPPHRSWAAETVKSAVKQGLSHLDQVTPDVVHPLGDTVAMRLRTLGWRPVSAGSPDGSGDAQPRYTFQLPLAGRSLAEIRAGMNSEWRRALTKAERSGIETRVGAFPDLDEFFELLRVTEARNGFRLGRDLAYYQRQFRVLNAEEPERMKLYTARLGGELLAGHTMITAGRRIWYQTGASADHRRDVRPGHALQWHMIQDAHAHGAAVHDMRMVSPVIAADDRRFGVLRWKLGTGGNVVEGLGEWEFAINGPLHRAFHLYLGRGR